MMSESPKAAYVRDGFYIHDAAVWPLDVVEFALEGMPDALPGSVQSKFLIPILRAETSVSARAPSRSGQSPQRV